MKAFHCSEIACDEFPVGPPLVPWIGNLLSLDPARPERSYAACAARYGPIYHVRLGALQQVVLSDPHLIREAFGRAEISARPDTAINTFIVDRSGLICSSGELWRETRRFTLHHLGSLGMGKTSLEPYIQGQVSAFMERVLEPSCGAPLSLDTPLNSAIINIIWRLVASEEVDITDDSMSGVLRRQGAIIGASARLVLLDTVPWLAPLLEPLLVDKRHIAAEFGALLEETFTPVLRRHRDTLPADGDAPRDYMDAMLMEQRRRPELMTDWHMLMSVLHLFFAGSDTTATTLRWALGFLCQRPDVQRRLQAELDAEVGRQRPPTLADRQRLPFTEAVILETQRLGDLLPVLVPHQTTAPVTVGGYRLPAGVQVIGNVQAVHRSARYFAEPLQFRPERFIDAQGQFQPDKNVMAFSVGRRQCLGESLARAELFLFLTAFLQKFSFCWPEGDQQEMAEDPKYHLVRCPLPFKLVPELR
ncbi:Cytochrome P450 2J6 [Amphibalanus amphitrite]|uniref:Cytochrome P450 2J6 n=1 Tax=Amphibalanus amphitrite TaxID=1232801 RepID=A0A6A4WSL5_AMPAM|nr:Cytochrome P450 2J6 [Amphibalanus amphitrite]